MSGSRGGAPPSDVLGLVGSTIDQIRFDACIDVAGFGIVYRGLHLGLNEPVAIKCLRLSHVKTSLVSQQAADEAQRVAMSGRFRDETRLLYHLARGNLDIVRCISSGELFATNTGERVPYMVLEWLDGQMLNADLEERKAKGLPGRSLNETLDLLESAALALAYAHGQGVVHRDIKPGNLFVARTRTGIRTKVLDFGVAKILSDEALGFGQSVQTADGVHLVSPAYAAPEQFSRQGGRLGPWTDVYSLTLVILEVMLGDKVRGQHGNPTTSPKASSLGLNVARSVEELLHRAVSGNPLERPANAGVFWASLRELARTSIPPVSNQSPALAATAYDGDVAAAMLKVRAATAPPGLATAPTANADVADANQNGGAGAGAGAGGGGTPPPQVNVRPNVPPTVNDPYPFVGTMMMVGAPGGGPLQAFDPKIMTKEHEGPGSTAPLAMPVNANLNQRSPVSVGPPQSSQASPPPPQSVISPNAVTAGIQIPPSPIAIPSPLAASLGPGVVSPLPPGSQLPQIIGAIAPKSDSNRPPPTPAPNMQRPPTPQPMHQQQQQQQQQHAPQSMQPVHPMQQMHQQPAPSVPPTSLPPMLLGNGTAANVPSTQRGSILIVGILVFVVLAIGAVSAYVLLHRAP